MKMFRSKKKVAPDRRKSIMIVEDSKSVQLVIGALFEKDFNVIYKEDGQEALNYIFDIGIPDLVLLDMEMPNMNGRVFLRRLKHNVSFKDIPVIFISTVNSRLIINTMIKLGIADYLIKPFKVEELTEKVYAILNKKT